MRAPARRDVLRLGGAGLVALACGAAAAHTPYRQWVVYRRKHLLIGCHRDDDPAHAAARAAAAHLEEHLPTARARVARAPAATRLAALMATDQLDLAVLAPGEVEGMMTAAGPFSVYGRVPLTTLLPLGSDHALVAHARFPDDHAALVAEALRDAAVARTEPRREAAPPAPWHPGVGAGADARKPDAGGD